MIPFHSKTRFFLYSHPTDMRQSFDGLTGLVTNILSSNPMSGDVYLFINRRRDKIKMLVWGGDGFWILYKRLEKGTIQIPTWKKDGKSIEISYEILIMLLEGIDINFIKRRKRFRI